MYAVIVHALSCNTIKNFAHYEHQGFIKVFFFPIGPTKNYLYVDKIGQTFSLSPLTPLKSKLLSEL